MKYKGKPLNSYTKPQLIKILEQVLKDLQMLTSTQPGDLEEEDMGERVWTPPQNVNVIIKGD